MVFYKISETTALLKSYAYNLPTASPNIIGVRHIQIMLMFFGICFGYFLRVNISAAIVPMAQTKSQYQHYNKTIMVMANVTMTAAVTTTTSIPILTATSTSSATMTTTMWNATIKSLILSSFFWGYVLAQIPSSLLAKHYGGKVVLGFATIIGSIITLLHPLATIYGDWILLCCLRVIVGITQGTVYPCLHTLLAQWVPSTERGFLSSLVYSGAQFGTAILLAISGSIFDSKWGWPGLFYISGTLALIWSIIFLLYGSDKPEDNRIITMDERKYIEMLTGNNYQNTNLIVPWLSILTSVPFLALIAAHCGFTWGFYTLLTQLPTYMFHVLDFNVKSNALFSALPYFIMWLLCLIVSPIADLIINHHVFSVSACRKIFNSIGQWIPMACLIALSFLTKDSKCVAIVLLTIAIGFNAACCCGYLVNHMDLSPNFAGPLMGLTNCISNLLSLCAPLIVGIIVHNEKDPTEWRIVFLITAIIYFISNSLFVLFGKATIQLWNDNHVTNSTIFLTDSITSIQLPTTGAPNNGQYKPYK